MYKSPSNQLYRRLGGAFTVSQPVSQLADAAISREGAIDLIHGAWCNIRNTQNIREHVVQRGMYMSTIAGTV